MTDDGKATRPRPHRRTGDGPPPDPALSLDRIVAAAVEILDTEGVDGLTMRGLARRLGAGAMSLYWHVPGREAVLDLALDAVLACEPPAEDREPRAEIVHLLEDWRAAILRHPWSAALLPRRPLGPSTLARLERLASALSRAGVADADLNVGVWSLWNVVIGAATTRASFAVPADEQGAAAERAAAFPTLARTRLLADEDWDGAFRKGVAFLLDGLAPR